MLTKEEKQFKILDACCGSKMFWFDKDNESVLFQDNRKLNTTLCDGRKLIIEPDHIGDFRDMDFPDNQFHNTLDSILQRRKDGR